MPAANDQQMQNYAGQWVRPVAEDLARLKVRCEQARTLIDDIYARAISNSRWDDNRSDGPPHMLQSGNGADPDDMLNFNTAMAMVEKFFAGTFVDANEANLFASCWNVLKDACVRGVA